MKKLLLLFALLTACQKEPLTIQVGMMYHIKSDIFSAGAYQPIQPVRVDKLYTDPISGYPFVEATDQSGTVWYMPQEDLKK